MDLWERSFNKASQVVISNAYMYIIIMCICVLSVKIVPSLCMRSRSMQPCDIWPCDIWPFGLVSMYVEKSCFLSWIMETMSKSLCSLFYFHI